MSFNEWKYVKVKDIAEIIFSGGTPSTQKAEFWNGKINWLSSGETRSKFIYNTEKKITQEGVDNSSTKLAKKKDIVIASAGQGFTRGQTSMCLIDTYINQSLICIRAKKDVIDPYYLFYNISSRYAELRQISDGHSIRGSLTTKIISDLNISLPIIKEQIKIGETLFAIDEKIETNNKINKKLEEMAQAIFKQWFIDFEFPNEDGKPYKSSGGEMVESELGMIPKGWNSKSLLDIANYLNGLAMQKFRPEDDEKGIPVLKIKELRQGKSDENSDLCSLNIDPKYIIHDGDVIFSWSGSLLVDFWCGGKCGLNQHLFKVTSSKFEKWFYYLWTKYHLDKFTRIAKDKATTMGHIKRADLSNSIVLVPNEVIMNKANLILNPIVEKIIEARIEERKLSQLRDTLLPKLMSGEIRVPID